MLHLICLNGAMSFLLVSLVVVSGVLNAENSSLSCKPGTVQTHLCLRALIRTLADSCLGLLSLHPVARKQGLRYIPQLIFCSTQALPLISLLDDASLALLVTPQHMPNSTSAKPEHQSAVSPYIPGNRGNLANSCSAQHLPVRRDNMHVTSACSCPSSQC